MRLLQFRDSEGTRRVGVVQNSETIEPLVGEQTVYDLALEALGEELSLTELVSKKPVERTLAYEGLVAERRILPPLDHPDPAHTLVTGTGLTHLGSADARDRMHKLAQAAQARSAGEAALVQEALTDSMRMFNMGLQGGKPAAGAVGVQPEWFYKGDGSIIVAPYQTLMSPAFALDGGEEPEIAGLYVIGLDGIPRRLGYALGNEFSDHVMEKQNYLYLAHSKLRPCAVGPELRLGELPASVVGTSRVLRGGQTLWERPFLSGEANMSHTLANLEHHHFKYAQFRRPGDVHIHFFGTATLSFTEGIVLLPGDEMEIEAGDFGRPLRNTYAVSQETGSMVWAL
jgi:hypothetical protein